VVEISDLDAICEQHAIALPVESVREDHLSFGADRNVMDLGGALHPITHLQIELTLVRRSELVRRPVLHRRHSARSATDRRESGPSRVDRWLDCRPLTVLGSGGGGRVRARRYTRLPVKSSLEALEGNKVKLYVEVEEDEFEHDIDRAFKAIAKEISLPGFRSGKVPRKVLEARVGLGPAREQALRDAVPQYLARAVREHDVDLIATPEVEITEGEESGPVEFDATCEIRPTITVEGYADLKIELPSIEVTDDDLTKAHETEQRRHASLADADRPIAIGDFVTLDIAAVRDGEEVLGLNTEDWSYEVGQGWVTDDFDEQLIGASAGDELTFTSTPKGTEGEADFTVKVTAVQEQQLADLDDEWVSEHLGEFDTLAEWDESLRKSLGEQKLNRARQQLVNAVTAALGALVEIDPPEPMVNSDLNQRVQGTVQQFQAQGIDLGQWLAATGQEPDQFVESMRGQSEEAVKVDLALRAVADAEEIVVEGPELEAEYARMAMQYGQKAKDIRRAYEQNDAVPDLVSSIRKSKALDWLIHHLDFVDADGNAIGRDELLGHGHDEHGNHIHEDHDHDHDDHDHDHDHDHTSVSDQETETDS
jgi:trigger factor